MTTIHSPNKSSSAIGKGTTTMSLVSSKSSALGRRLSSVGVRRESSRRSSRRRTMKFQGGAEGLEARHLLAADPVISEFVAQNVNGLADEDAQVADWLEIVNRGDTSADLSNYYVSNDSANLTKWQIPAGTTVGAGDFLVIFASGKDRAVSGNELHTNFVLDDLGGDLILTAPNGTSIVDSVLQYGETEADASYARIRNSGSVDYIGDTSVVRVLSPTSGALGTTWRGGSEPFDDGLGSGWLPAIGTVGYDTRMTSSAFRVEAYYSNATLDSLALADNAIAGNNLRAGSPHVADHPVVNFFDVAGGGGFGNFGSDVPFPGDTAGDDNNFTIRATAEFFVSAADAGTWTFGFNVDDGGRIRIDGVTVVEDNTNNATTDYLGTIDLMPGQHSIEFVFYEAGGGGAAELYAAKGTHLAFSSAAFSLIGDPNGVLPLGNLDDLITTDIEGAMYNNNASVYLRYPFEVVEADSVTSMSADMLLDDGAVVYLNGTAVYTHNAPASPTFNSTALAKTGVTQHKLDLSDHLDKLRDGDNILAIHGLNAGASDMEYLASVNLSARVLGAEAFEFTDLPTPGARNGFIAPVITEFQADNSGTIEDEDGEETDWIEIHNPGTIDQTLTDWYLTDDAADLAKWQFPATILPAGGYMVVFASGKDKGGFGDELHTNFALGRTGEYLALTRPDGVTVQWEYETGGRDYGLQFPNVSFGLRGAETFGGSGDNDPVRGLVGYWDFEDGTGSTTAVDRTGNNAPANLNNMEPATDWVQGRNASTRALQFDGVDEFVLTSANASALGFPAGTQRTIAGWVQTPSIVPATTGGVFQIGASPNSQLALHNNGVGITWAVEHSGELEDIIFSTTANQWFHFAITYDGSMVRVFRGGTLVTEVENTDLTTDDVLPLVMGRWTDATGVNRFFRGKIDEIAVWDYALKAETVAGLANGTYTPVTAPTVSRLLGTTGEGFTIRQVNASASFPGQVTGQVGAGANPLADADLLLGLPEGHAGIAAERTDTFDLINFYDDAGLGGFGNFRSDDPFPLDDEIGDDNNFALKATATLVVPEGKGGTFIFGVHSDEGSRLRIDGVDVIVDNTRHPAELRTGTINLSEGEHTLELVYFENVGGAELELSYASITNGRQDSDLSLLTILPDLRIPEPAPTVFNAERVYFPEPTPGMPNNFGAENFIGRTTFSVPHGFYNAPFQLEISNETRRVELYYTTDGTDPSPTNGTLYTGPITINRTTAIKVRGFLENAAPSAVTAATYLFLADVVTQSPTGQAPPGFPASWGPNAVDYGMDPNIVNSPTWGPQLEAALKQIPTMSVVMDLNDLFGSNGIYALAGQRGLEKPTSLELIYPEGYVRPDGTVPDGGGFTENAGIRIRGGFSRDSANPKHAFRFYFRKDYGDSQLRYPLFGEGGAQEFDKFDLRTTQNYSWAYQNDARNNFLRDIYSRDLMAELGQPTTRGDYYHLYINGQYFGLFQTEERPGADYAAENFGGETEDWDVVHNEIGQRQLGATDGNMDSSQRLWEQFVKPGGLSDANMEDYYRVQGMNPDGTRNSSYERMLDVDNLIAYMITTYYTSDADGPGSKFTRPQLNNYFAIYNRENPDGWKFLEHDSEHSLDTGNGASANYNMVSPLLNNAGSSVLLFNPHWMHEQLANSNSDYRQRFIDKVAEVFDPETGVLRPDNVKAMLQKRAAEFDLAIIAESARWGDRSGTLFTKTTWETAVTNTLNWVTNRQEELLNQLRCAGGSTARNPDPLTCQPTISAWYPLFGEPTIEPEGGSLTEPTDVTLTVPGNFTVVNTVRTSSAAVRYKVPDAAFNTSTGQSWINPTYNAGTWSFGTGGVGYETEAGGYTSLLGTAKVPAGTLGVYIRPPAGFTVPDTDSDGSIRDEVDELILRVRYDDGFVAYLNGVRVASANAPATPTYNSTATADRPDEQAVVFQEITLGPEAINALTPTGNVLAIHALNSSSSSPDMLLSYELVQRTFFGERESSAQIFYTVDGSDPRGSGNSPSSNAIAYNEADVLLDGTGSAKYIVANGAGSENGWQNPGYNDASWGTTPGGIGYDEDPEGTVETGQPGFLVRVINVSSPTVGDIATATSILDGTVVYAAISDTTRVDAYVNHGTNGTGSFTTPAELTPPGLSGDTEDYALRASAKVTIPAGTYSLAVTSDDGFRLTIPGITFTATSGENGNNGVGTNSIAYAAPRGNAATVGTFTLASPLTTTITLDGYERGGGDTFELSIANTATTAFNTTAFQILRDGTHGWDLEAAGVVVNSVDYAPLISTDVAALKGVPGSVYLRMPFNITDASEVRKLNMSALYDDGLAIFVNGNLVQNVASPDPTSFNSLATATRDDAVAINPANIDLTDALPFLVDGQNMLAVQVLKRVVDDTDLLFKLKSLSATLGGNPFQLSDNTLLKVRAFQNGMWSPLQQQFFQFTQPTVAITEINYNPYDPTDAELAVNENLDGDDFEFLEVANSGSEAIDLTGVQFTNGIEFTFGAHALAPGERAVIVRNAAAYALRYPSAPAPIGVYSGGLSNAGEGLSLVDGLGNLLLDFNYSDADPWPQGADGIGATLELTSLTTDTQFYSKHYSWSGSTDFGGSPGTAGSASVGVVINEVLTHTDPLAPQSRPGATSDSIELYNTTSSPIDIGGWYLSDAAGTLLKYRIPTGTTLPAGGYIVFDETDFNPSMGLDPINNPNDFALNATGGDDVYLVIPGGTSGVAKLVDNVTFGAAPNGESFGRTPNGSGRLAPMGRQTLGGANAEVRVGPIVISELQYNAGEPTASDLELAPLLISEDLEFVEIHNPTTTGINLTDWRLRGGVDYTFDDDLMLGAGQTLLVLSFNPANAENAQRLAAFRNHYGLSAGVAMVGGYNGQLSNDGERVQLQRPDAPPASDPTLIPNLYEDEILYDNRIPWSATANGGGDSFQRIAPVFYGDVATSWQAATPTPGTVSFSGISGDFNNDGTVNARDIDSLYDAIAGDRQVTYLDLDASGIIDQADVTFLVQNILGTRYGDANLDGTVDAQDFSAWNSHKFVDQGKSWSQGDFNGDGRTDASDFNHWNANKFQSGPGGAAASQRAPRAALADSTQVDAALQVYLAAAIDRPAVTRSLQGAFTVAKTNVQQTANEPSAVAERRFVRSQLAVRRASVTSHDTSVAQREQARSVYDRPFGEVVDQLFENWS
jgi:hypothetical protein